MEKKNIAKFGFLILTYCQSQDQLNTLKRNIEYIQRYHPEAPIVVLNDHSPFEIFLHNSELLTLVETKHPGSAEVAPFLYYRDNKFAERMIFLHDSMLLMRPLTDLHTIDISFLWHFTAHRLWWNKIEEPKNTYNIKHEIRTHDDLIQHLVKLVFDDSKSFVQYFKQIYSNKDKWVGCFGLMCIISHDFLCQLEQKTQFCKLASFITDRRRRCAAESIFAIACQFTAQTTTPFSSYDGLYYDGNNYHNNFKTKTFEKLVYLREHD